MKVAIIIPTHNREQNLACVLTSLSTQTRKPDEIIVVDDRSTDNSYQVAMTTKQIKYVYNPDTKGTWNASVPRNLGVRVTARDTDLVWFLDSDVVLPPDAVEKTMQAFESGDPNRCLIGSYHWLPAQEVNPSDVTNNWEKLKNGQLPHKVIERKGMIGTKDIRQASFDKAQTSQDMFSSFTDSLACFGGYLLMRKEIFLMAGGYDETMLAGVEDGDFGITLYEMGVPFSYLKETCGYHIAHEQPDGRTPMEITQQVKRLNDKHNVDMIHQSGKAYREWGIDWNPPPEFYDFNEAKLAEYKRSWKLDRIDLSMKVNIVK